MPVDLHSTVPFLSASLNCTAMYRLAPRCVSVRPAKPHKNSTAKTRFPKVAQVEHCRRVSQRRVSGCYHHSYIKTQNLWCPQIDPISFAHVLSIKELKPQVLYEKIRKVQKSTLLENVHALPLSAPQNLHLSSLVSQLGAMACRMAKFPPAADIAGPHETEAPCAPVTELPDCGKRGTVRTPHVSCTA